MDDSVAKAIDNYYKLKQAYKERIQRQKRKILNNDALSKKEKRQKWLREKKTCVSCKQAGGTTFANEGNILSAVCGGDVPCKLNIRIDRGYYTNIRTDCLDLYDEINKMRTEIIDVKLNLLFNYVGEDLSLKQFDKLRKSLKIFTDEYDRVLHQYLEVVNYGIRSEPLKVLQTRLFVVVEAIKKLVKEFEETKKKEYISTLVEGYYIAQIIPLVDAIREAMYRYNSLEKELEVIYRPNQPDSVMEIVKLKQAPYTLKDLYVPGAEPARILSNIY